jgi:hypothetical protein
MASKTTVRVLGFLIFVACAGVAGVGVWYWRGGGLPDEDETAADDDTDDIDPHAADGGAHRGGKKKKPGARRGKTKGSGHPPSAPAAPAGPAGPSGMSYEAALAGNNLHLAPGTKDAPDLTDTQLAGPMRNGTFLDACGAPESMHVTVKVAIKNGHAVGVSVYTNPPNAPVGYCIERQVRGLYWPSSAKMDSFVTTY